ncbi:hypothetical protein AAHH78_37175, partial [Burkholderia pseudomallei]
MQVPPALVPLIAPMAARGRVCVVSADAGRTPAADLVCPLLSLAFALGIDLLGFASGPRSLDGPVAAGGGVGG